MNNYASNGQTGSRVIIFSVVGAVLGIVTLGVLLWGYPQYRVWSREMNGKAQLAEAEWSKRIAIETAKAKKESATYEAEAEVARAKGVKESNDIIQQGLGGSEGYLRYLYIQMLSDVDSKGGQIIYVPTEAGLPILEAGKRE